MAVEGRALRACDSKPEADPRGVDVKCRPHPESEPVPQLEQDPSVDLGISGARSATLREADSEMPRTEENPEQPV